MSNSDVNILPYRLDIKEHWRDNGKIITSFILAVLILMVGTIINRGFTEHGHLILMIKVASFFTVIGIAQTTVILSGDGGIDLSVGTMASLGALLSASIMNGRQGMTAPAIIIVVLSGLALGMVNGYLISYLKIHPLIMTLAMSYVITGIIIAYSQGRTLLGGPSAFVERMSNGKIGQIPIVIFISVGLVIFFEWMLKRTKTGYTLLSVGTNETTASLSGIDVKMFRFWIYAISGGISAFFGILLLGYVHTVFLDVGNQYLFPSVVVCAIGGIVLTGGSGSYVGTLGGALVYTFLQSLLVTINVEESYRKALFGLILILLLIIYSRSNREE